MVTGVDSFVPIYGVFLEIETGRKEMSATGVPVSPLFTNSFFPLLRPAQSPTSTISILLTKMKESIGLGKGEILAVDLVHFCVCLPLLSLTKVDEGSAINLSDLYNWGGASRNPSRAYFHPVPLWRLIAPWVGTDLPKNLSRDHLGQYGGYPLYCTWVVGDVTANSETVSRNTGERTSRLELENPGERLPSRWRSRKDTSNMNNYATNKASRQYFTLHHLELTLNLFQWVPGHQLPLPHEYNEKEKGQVNQIYGHLGAARNKSREDFVGRGYRELSVRICMFAVAQTGTGLNLNHDDSGEGNYWSERRRDNRGASRMLFFLSFSPTCRPTCMEAPLLP